MAHLTARLATDPLVSRNKRYHVTDGEWDANGSYHLVICDNDSEAAAADVTPQSRRAVRDLARRIDPMKKIRWTRIDRIFLKETEIGRRRFFHITASRLDPMYR